MARLLPIGSVVSFAGSPQKYIIYGRLKKTSKNEHVYDYCACPYPWGRTTAEQDIAFDNEDIDLLHLIGFQDTEEFVFQHAIEEQYNAVKSNN